MRFVVHFASQFRHFSWNFNMFDAGSIFITNLENDINKQILLYRLIIQKFIAGI